jgi:hypothetical protein
MAPRWWMVAGFVGHGIWRLGSGGVLHFDQK